MPQITKYSGEALIATGVVHTLAGIWNFRRELKAIGLAGIVNSLQTDKERQLAFWFVNNGIIAILLGVFTRWVQQRTDKLPAFHGLSLLGIGLVGVVVMPRSGFWLVLPPAVLSLADSRRVKNMGINLTRPTR